MERFDWWSIGDGIYILKVVVENNIEDIVGNIEGIMDFYHRKFSILVTKMDFQIGVARFFKVGEYSNYSNFVHDIEIVDWDISPYLVDKAVKVF